MLRLEGTEFQCDVWQALLDIPYRDDGVLRRHRQGRRRPKAVRAVGSANGANPICIIIPCHRIIGSGGGLVGYGGGLDRKEWLIEHEWKHNALAGEAAEGEKRIKGEAPGSRRSRRIK